MNRDDDYKQNCIEDLYKYRHHFWVHHRNKIIFDAIRKYCRKPREHISILELGAGSGNISCFLKNVGYNVDASDMYNLSLRYLKDKVGNIFVYDIVADEIPAICKNRYDVVILGDVIEHLNHPESALKKARAFLVSGGIFLIIVPALMQLWTPYDKFCGHKKRYNKKILSNELTNSNIMIEEIRYFMFFPAIVLFFQRKIKSLFKKTEGSFSDELNINHIINKVMNSIMVIEYWLWRIIDFPFGSSLIAVGRKK